MRMTWSALAACVIAVALGAMVPGPTTALVVRRSAVDGSRAAVPLVLGIETGLYTWVIASALGVAAVVAASETAYMVLRYVGARVLLLLGIQAWLASRRISVESPAVAETVAPSRWWRAATTGAVTQLSNPKVAVFMVASFRSSSPLHPTSC
jgi:threonine/homoserine/homoserine lactone efflux protein